MMTKQLLKTTGENYRKMLLQCLQKTGIESFDIRLIRLHLPVAFRELIYNYLHP